MTEIERKNLMKDKMLYSSYQAGILALEIDEDAKKHNKKIAKTAQYDLIMCRECLIELMRENANHEEFNNWNKHLDMIDNVLSKYPETYSSIFDTIIPK